MVHMVSDPASGNPMWGLPTRAEARSQPVAEAWAREAPHRSDMRAQSQPKEQDQCHVHVLKALDRRPRRRRGDDALWKTLNMGDSMSRLRSDAGESA